ncbi:uncharacterized protein [Littorina saxatilis]|uniref:ubiquitinyl hydrolase 1 n=1 Tax=Littorina saxatilis TaxID=31220 RepID=A0AAN9GGL2_9CAEN
MSKALLFFEDSNHRRKDMLLQWVVSNIDYSQLKKELPVCFYRNTSFYLTELPDFSRWPQDFKARVLAVLVDADMKDDLERAGVINWCRNVRIVVPINVPKDGNCLLHAVGIAVWGILDSTLMLRRLLGLALSVDKGRRFFSRWMYHRQMQMSQVSGRLLESGTEALKKEWSEISNCLDPDHSSSAAVPHRFLESIHVYTLANILRRPIIIMTDPTMRAFSGFALQDNDMGGIYLPLEWNWKDTHRTPLLLGYSCNHFSPLLFADHPNQAMAGATQKKDLAPLVNANLEQLPVRFLLQGEEPEVGELLRKYLRIKETVTTLNGTVQNILCAELEICNLPDELNLVNDYFREFFARCKQEQTLIYPARMPTQGLPGHLHRTGQPNMLSQSALYQPAQQNALSHALGSSQRVVREQLQGMRESEYGLGETALQIPNPCGQGSVRIPPPSFTPRYSFGENSVSLNPPQDRKCVVPRCKFFGDPDLAMMCSNCFKDYTIKESRRLVITGGAFRTPPSAPLDSMQGEEQQYEMSMMTERCQTGCGFRCSTKTYPYCHECVGRRQKQAQEEANKVRESESAGAHLTTSGQWMGASGASPVMSHTSQHPPDVFRQVVSTQPMDQNQAEATPPSSPLPVSSAEPGMPRVNQPSGEASASSAPAAEATSPTQALAAGPLSAPLTPPDDPSDLMLFGSGEPSPVESPARAQLLTPVAANSTQAPVLTSGNAATVSATTTTQSQPQASTSQQTAGLAQPTSQPQMPLAGERSEESSSQQKLQEQGSQTGGIDEQNMPPGGRLIGRQNSVAGENRQQLAPTSSITEQKQQQEKQKTHPRCLTGQAMLSSGLTESQIAEAVLGPAQEEPRGKCTSPSCGGDVVCKSLCGNCFVTKGGKGAPVQKIKNMSLNSTRSSAPASIGVQATDPKSTYAFMGDTQGTFKFPMNQPRASSLTYLPNEFPPLSANNTVYVRNWLEDVSKNPVSKPPALSKQKSQPMGLPENQESEPLPGRGSDLLASGEQCYSATARCIGEACNNSVRQEGQLCDQCKEILRQARQGQGLQQSSRTSVQESLPPAQSLCKTDGCNYCGNPIQLGFCSHCYEQLVKSQQEEERRYVQQVNRRVPSPLPQSAPANIRVPEAFLHVPIPQKRQGELCRAAGCNMFGDPKQSNMCFKHYQEYLAHIPVGAPNAPPQSATFMPPSPRRTPVNIPYAEELTITPSGATFVTPGGGRQVLFGTAELPGSGLGLGSFPQGEVSVPPPSYPTPESAPGVAVRSQGQSLDETYNRVVGRHVSRCMNTTCSNYGNSSKGGLCNSCASNQQLREEQLRRTILGDEEIG